MEFWAAMGIVALALGLNFFTRTKQRQWHQERLERWEAFKKEHH